MNFEVTEIGNIVDGQTLRSLLMIIGGFVLVENFAFWMVSHARIYYHRGWLFIGRRGKELASQ